MKFASATYVVVVAAAIFVFHDMLLVALWGVPAGTAVLLVFFRALRRKIGLAHAARSIVLFFLSLLLLLPLTFAIERLNRYEVGRAIGDVRSRAIKDCAGLKRDLSTYSDKRRISSLGYRWVVLPDDDCNGVVVLYQMHGKKEIFDLASGEYIRIERD